MSKNEYVEPCRQCLLNLKRVPAVGLLVYRDLDRPDSVNLQVEVCGWHAQQRLDNVTRDFFAFEPYSKEEREYATSL